MQPDVVCAVSEEGLPRPCAPGECHRVVNQHVRMVVRTEAEGVDDERLYACKGFDTFVVDALHVCDICQTAEAEGGDGQLVVHHADGHDRDVADAERLIVGYGVKMQARHAGIEMLGKDVWHRRVETVNSLTVGIDRDVAEGAEGAEVVKTPYMVVVDVRQQDTVDAPERLAQHLLADVGAAVYENACRGRLDKGAAAVAVVARVKATADGAVASYNRHTAGCACPEESQGQG